MSLISILRPASNLTLTEADLRKQVTCTMLDQKIDELLETVAWETLRWATLKSYLHERADAQQIRDEFSRIGRKHGAERQLRRKTIGMA